MRTMVAVACLMAFGLTGTASLGASLQFDDPSSPDWLDMTTWDVDLRGSDFTAETDPIAREYPSAEVPGFLWDQQGYYRLHFSADVPLTPGLNPPAKTRLVSLSLQPADGWFTSLDMWPGTNEQNEVVGAGDWSTTAAEKIAVTVTPGGVGCTALSQTDVTETAATGVVEVQWANTDEAVAWATNTNAYVRNDRLTINVDANAKLCNYVVTIDIYLRTIHEIMRPVAREILADYETHFGTQEPADAKFSVARKRADLSGSDTHSKVLDPMIDYYPVIPLQRVIDQVSDTTGIPLPQIANNTPTGGRSTLVYDVTSEAGVDYQIVESIKDSTDATLITLYPIAPMPMATGGGGGGGGGGGSSGGRPLMYMY